MPLGPVVVLGDVEALCFPESLMGSLRQTESAALCVHSGHVCSNFVLNKLVLVYAFGFKPVLCFTTNAL